MYYNNDIEFFLEELKKYINKQNKYKHSSVSSYLNRIKRVLKSGYTVTDLCVGVDQLLEDYSRGGNKYDEDNHGKTKSALNQVRKMIKGDIISSLTISYQGGFGTWKRKNEYVVKYCIKEEKIVFYLNTSRKRYIHKMSPTNTGKLIYILQDAKNQGFLCDQQPRQFTQSSFSIIDAPPPSIFEYTIGDDRGVCFGSLLIDSNNPKRMALQSRYDQLISQIISPYML